MAAGGWTPLTAELEIFETSVIFDVDKIIYKRSAQSSDNCDTHFLPYNIQKMSIL